MVFSPEMDCHGRAREEEEEEEEGGKIGRGTERGCHGQFQVSLAALACLGSLKGNNDSVAILTQFTMTHGRAPIRDRLPIKF